MKANCLFVMLFFVCACGEDTHQLEKMVKYKADSLFRLEYQLLTREQDSLCTLRKETSIKIMLDSIVQLRKNQIIQLQQGL